MTRIKGRKYALLLIQRCQNAELFTLTYGAFVVQLIQDYEDYAEVNRQLDIMYVHLPTSDRSFGVMRS